MACSVLIIEDEPHIVESLRFILGREGFDVTAVDSAESGLLHLENSPPDVLVLDAMLPGESGFDLLRRIRSREDLAALSVLMLTAKGQRKDREVAESLGANRFMTKPFANAEVIAAVKELSTAARS